MTEDQAVGFLARTAIIGYYSDETARAAVQDLHENMAFGLNRPLKLKYYGPIEMKEVGTYSITPPFLPSEQTTEAELIKSATAAILLNGIHTGH
jgi:hypothetical protein